MGKTTATEAEARLTELIREANAATKDLTRAIERGKHEVVHYGSEHLQEVAAQICNAEVERLLQGVNNAMHRTTQGAVDQLITEFHRFVSILLGAEIKQLMDRLVTNGDIAQLLTEKEIEFSEEFIAVAMALQARIRAVGKQTVTITTYARDNSAVSESSSAQPIEFEGQ